MTRQIACDRCHHLHDLTGGLMRTRRGCNRPESNVSRSGQITPARRFDFCIPLFYEHFRNNLMSSMRSFLNPRTEQILGMKPPDDPLDHFPVAATLEVGGMPVIVSKYAPGKPVIFCTPQYKTILVARDLESLGEIVDITIQRGQLCPPQKPE